MVRSSCCVSPSAWVCTAVVMAFNCSWGVAYSIELHTSRIRSVPKKSPALFFVSLNPSLKKTMESPRSNRSVSLS